MLENTFIHIPRIGRGREEKIWSAGIFSWDDYLQSLKPPLAGKAHLQVRKELDLSLEKLASSSIDFFYHRLPSGEHWRLFSNYREEAVYLDIETTGLGGYGDHITTIALYTGGNVKYYVHGENLADFPGDIADCKLLITYNGKCFDVPFIEREFGFTLSVPHIDLRYLLQRLGYRGGLKGCERQLGISRENLEGVDGYFAVLLWQEYKRNANIKALETLLAYNIEDTVNLATLMALAYNEKIREIPFPLPLLVQDEVEVSLPFQGDLKTIESLRQKYYGYPA